MNKSLSRRSFLKGSLATALGAAGAAMLPNMRAVAESSEYTYADTIAWDGEYDVVVMGFGGAGAVAANFAGKNGAKVLLFDVAPKGHEGGNTRYCLQIVMCGTDKEGLLTYYRGLNEGFDYDDELLQVFTEELTKVHSLLETEYDATEVTHWRGFPPFAWGLPEYPHMEGSEHVDVLSIHNGFGDGALWEALRNKAVSNENVDVLYEARGTKLIQDPETKTILGVTLEKDGQLFNIRAINGVVMTCGGFENNPKMIANYLLLEKSNPTGTLYNRGDGITMAAEVNADFWHMASYEANGRPGGLGYDLGPGVRQINPPSSSGSFIVVGPNGQRYMDETYQPKHGRLSYYGSYHTPPYPEVSYMIMDEPMMQEVMAAGRNIDSMQSVMTSANSFEELATALNLTTLIRSIGIYNRYVEEGEDIDFGRDPATMRAMVDGKCYALRLAPTILNTQGGARRNARAEVLDVHGNPIPHLYSAGEFGGLTSHYYQGGTNMAEVIIFGKIAGENAAMVKEKLPAYVARQKVESTLRYVPGTSEENGATGYEVGENEYVGTGSGMGGDVVVKCTIVDGKITNAEVLVNNETAGISDPAFEKVLPQFIGCSSVAEIEGIDAVSGATMTSNALKNAVIDCLNQAQ